MAYSDLQLKVAAETAIMGIQKHMGALKEFAHDFKELSDRKGAAIAVPVYNLSAAAEFDEATNNWCSGTNEIDGVTVNLDKHFIKSIALNDVQNAEADVNFLRDGAQAIAEVLAHAANKYVFGLMTDTNLPLSASFDGSSKAVFANLFKIADDNGLNPYECVVALTPEYFAKALSYLDSNVYGGSEAIRTGVIPGLYGFSSVICTSYLPNSAKGVIIKKDAIGIASRVNSPVIDGYAATWTAASPDGIAIGFRAFEHLCFGKAYLGGDILFGARVLQTNGGVRLV